MEENRISPGKIIGWILLAILVIAIISVGIWYINWKTSGFRGHVEMEVETNSADYRRGAYESFYNDYNDIQALERRIDGFIAQLKTLEKGSKDYNRVMTNITGVQGLRLDAITNYNANADKEFTAGKFLPDDLPRKIPVTDYPEGGIK